MPWSFDERKGSATHALATAERSLAVRMAPATKERPLTFLVAAAWISSCERKKAFSGLRDVRCSTTALRTASRSTSPSPAASAVASSGESLSLSPPALSIQGPIR